MSQQDVNKYVSKRGDFQFEHKETGLRLNFSLPLEEEPLNMFINMLNQAIDEVEQARTEVWRSKELQAKNE